MTSQDKRRKLYIEASAITEQRMSGISHTIASMIRSLITNTEFVMHYKIILIVPHGTLPTLDRWHFPNDVVEAKQIWLEKHVFQVIFKYGFLPPVDIFFGKGVYLFPNYKTWPLLFSKSITYIYDVAFSIYPETVQTKNLAMLQRLVPKWIERTDFVVTVSKNSKKEIVEQLDVPNGKVGVAYCGVDKNEFGKRTDSEVAAAKAKYAIKGNYLLFIGNIEPRKNILRLMEAYTLLPTNLRDEYSLVLIGSGGWLNEDIIESIGDLQAKGYKIIHPNVYVPDEDLPKLYSGASLLVHPAIHEGFGIPPLQAMACGIPVAVSDVSSLPEVVGKAGAYFDPRDSQSIADIIKSTLTDPSIRRKMIDAGTKQAQKFTWDKSAVELIKYINNIAGIET